jgi:hypothetical protein
MIEIKYIRPDQINEIWPFIEQWVVNSLGEDISWTQTDIKDALINNQFELRLITNNELKLITNNELKGFIVSVIYDAPRCKVAYAPWLGGKDLQEWVAPAFEHFKNYLKSIGVRQYSFAGRKAWTRFLDVTTEQAAYFIKL